MQSKLTKRLLGRSVTPSSAAGTTASTARASCCAAEDPVEQQCQDGIRHLVDVVAAGGGPPLRGDPQHVPQQPVGEPCVEVGAEDAGLLAALELRDPRPLDLAERLAQVAEAVLRAEVAPVVLQHGEGG